MVRAGFCRIRESSSCERTAGSGKHRTPRLRTAAEHSRSHYSSRVDPAGTARHPSVTGGRRRERAIWLLRGRRPTQSRQLGRSKRAAPDAIRRRRVSSAGAGVCGRGSLGFEERFRRWSALEGDELRGTGRANPGLASAEWGKENRATRILAMNWTERHSRWGLGTPRRGRQGPRERGEIEDRRAGGRFAPQPRWRAVGRSVLSLGCCWRNLWSSSVFRKEVAAKTGEGRVMESVPSCPRSIASS